MVFSSIEYLFIFIPAFLFAYIFLPNKNGTLFSFSILFYTWGEGYYVLLLLFSIGMNGWVGKSMAAHRSYARRYLAAGIFLNLFILGVFKYSGFVLTDLFGLPLDPTQWNIRLPIGISFFTFQAISYLVDIYRRPQADAASLISVGTYIAMFPQLIAGPIVRYHTVADQLKQRHTTIGNLRIGALFFSIGLAQKTLIANNLAIGADAIFASTPAHMSIGTAWMGAITYSLQIYFDFSGYSHMAIGLGYCLGFVFPENFNFPYTARSITDFWRRWHMSLSTWFRDYLYIPLGGNRHGGLATYRNLWIVFILCGLWHGASWTFLFWGAYHGLLLVLERLYLAALINRIPRFLGNIYTMLAVMVGWVFFRADDFGNAIIIIQKMMGHAGGDVSIFASQFIDKKLILVLLMGIVFSTPLVYRRLPAGIRAALSRCAPAADEVERVKMAPATLSWAISAALMVLSVFPILAGGYNPFIYFRF